MINNVRSEIGYFANAVDNIAITTDGVGTKALIASIMGRYDTIGIDCVAMNVNDLIAYGATPKAMVDYIVLPQHDESILKAIHHGLNIGAKRANIDIVGGETAILNHFDLSGTAIGYIDKPLIGEDVKSGDLIIGLASNGIHCNGVKKAWDIFSSNGYNLNTYIEDFQHTLGEEFLKPTNIYTNTILHHHPWHPLISNPKIKAIINITGGGFDNLRRIATKHLGTAINIEINDNQPLFTMLEQLSKLSIGQMAKYWNLGYGMCYICSPDYNYFGKKIGYMV